MLLMGIKNPALFGDGVFSFKYSVRHPRESRDNPKLNAFWRVAPSDRFNLPAILLAGVLPRASDFSSRTSTEVHARLLDAFLTICSMYGKGRSYIFCCFRRKGLENANRVSNSKRGHYT